MTDTALLDWLADNGIIEGFANVPRDIYEIAAEIAIARGADDIERKDLRLALRELLKLAATAENTKARQS